MKKSIITDTVVKGVKLLNDFDKAFMRRQNVFTRFLHSDLLLLCNL